MLTWSQGFHSIKNTRIDKIQRNYAAFGGACPRSQADAVTIPSNHKLQHVDPGLLSVSKDGSHFALTLRRALPLDDGYRVIGRVAKGMDVLTSLNDVDVNGEERPDVPILIEQCGLTNHKGENETFSAAGTDLGQDLNQGARDGLQSASQRVQSAVKDGLKRSAPSKVAPNKRRHIVDSASSSESSDDDGD